MNPFKKAVIVGALVVTSTSCVPHYGGYLDHPPEQSTTTTTWAPPVIQEDDPRWNCFTMGDLICGPEIMQEFHDCMDGWMDNPMGVTESEATTECQEQAWFNGRG